MSFKQTGFLQTTQRNTARGIWLDLPSAEVAEIAAGAGFDFALIDMEHGAIDFAMMVSMLRGLERGNISPIVRIADDSVASIKRTLDAGATALMVPQIDTVAQARGVVSAFRYPPMGRRGKADAVVRAADYGENTDYAANWNRTGRLILQIESPEALERVEEIASVDGVDALFFGPADYGATAGVDPEGPELRQALERIRDAAHAQGLSVGSTAFPNVDANELANMAIDFYPVAFDVRVLADGMRRVLAQTE